MDPKKIDDLLRPTLEDHRLSRGERTALRRVIEELSPSPSDLDTIRSRAFRLARSVLPQGPDTEALVWLEDVVRLLDGLRPRGADTPLAEACFSPGPDCLARITGLLAGARASADICVYTITDNRIADEILAAHRRGVRVRILTDLLKAEDAGSDVNRLASAGIAVVVDDSEVPMHHKFAVIDGSVVVTGSYNWTRSAAEANAENLVVTDDPRLVRAFEAEFARLWARWG